MPDADLIFAGILVATIAVITVLLWGKGKASFDSSLRQLQENGHVITHSRQRHRGPVTWIWGRYPEPVPFYLHFSNRDPVAVAVGELGVADISTGHSRFDRRYFVRSNRPDWARAFLTRALCDELQGFESLEFLTSSVGNVLSPDYWPDQANRALRDVWMLRVDGKLSIAEAEPYVELARRLSGSLVAFCADKKLDAGTEVTSMFEGR